MGLGLAGCHAGVQVEQLDQVGVVGEPVEWLWSLEQVLAASDGVDEGEALLLRGGVVQLCRTPGSRMEGEGLVLLLQGWPLQLIGVALGDDSCPVRGAGVREHAHGLAWTRVAEGLQVSKQLVGGRVG